MVNFVIIILFIFFNINNYFQQLSVNNQDQNMNNIRIIYKKEQ